MLASQEHVSSSVLVADDGPRLVRQSLGLPPDAPLRIAYVAGPGDACGTFEHWRLGAHDPRIPVVTYSSMFYSLVEALDATALLLIEQDKQPSVPDPRFQFVYTKRTRGRRGLAYRVDEFAFAKRVLKHLNEYRPDVILIGTDAPPWLIRNLPNAKRIVLTAHNCFWPMGNRPGTLRARLKLHALSRALRRVDVAVNTSGECAVQVAALGGPTGARSFTETPQVLEAFFPPLLEEQPLARRLLYLGRIEANKGVFDLLGAFAALAKDRPNLELGFAGAGSGEIALKSAIAGSGHSDRVTMHGLLPSMAVHNLLDQSDLLICPTRSDFAEGLALVAIEAAVHGVPTLLSSIVPAKALLPGGCVEFPVDDTSALTERLREVVDDPATYSALRRNAFAQRARFLDRAESWGSQLYRALALGMD